MTILLRFGMRTMLKALRRRGHNLRHILIVGTNRRAIKFASEIEAKPELGYIVAGFVDEPDRRDVCKACAAFKHTNYRVVSDVNGLSAYIRKNVVDEVVVALPVKSFYQEISRIINICAEQGVLNRHLPDIFNRAVDKFRLEDIDEQSMMPRNRSEAEEWQVLIKWIIDKILATSILILLAPLFAIVAIAIKLDSPGPVFFIQKRVGLNKRVFRVFKFRTMSVDAPLIQATLESKNEASGPVFKIKNDPRVTRLGQFLRKTSIDEFPQLINVLKGEMSIVGPRPLPLRDFDGFDRDWLHRRFSVMPGITCLWQVSGRSNIAFERWMRLDLQYIDQWSLWLDFKILLMTFRAVLSGSGAA